jgi:hypothetical protein
MWAASRLSCAAASRRIVPNANTISPGHPGAAGSKLSTFVAAFRPRWRALSRFTNVSDASTTVHTTPAAFAARRARTSGWRNARRQDGSATITGTPAAAGLGLCESAI